MSLSTVSPAEPRNPGIPGEERVPIERLFERAFRNLNPALAAPAFDIMFRPYAALRSNIRYDCEARCMRARLSDLLLAAPPEVLEALATMLLSRLYDKRVPATARRAYGGWVYSARTQERMLEARRARGSKRMLPAQGRFRDLDLLFDSLNQRFFQASLRKPELGWSDQASRRRLGHFDPAHDAIVVSSILDSPDVPVLALEYVLYHEMLHVKHPCRFGGGGRCVHTEEFRADERRFSGYEEARRVLRAI